MTRIETLRYLLCAALDRLALEELALDASRQKMNRIEAEVQELRMRAIKELEGMERDKK